MTHLPRGTRARVSLAAPAGSAPTPAPLCRTESPRRPSLCSPGPPCNKDSLSPCWGRGARGSGSWRDPPFSPPASGLSSSLSSRCQEAAGRSPRISELACAWHGPAPGTPLMAAPHPPAGVGTDPGRSASLQLRGGRTRRRHVRTVAVAGAAGLSPSGSRGGSGVSGALCWWGWGWSGARLCRRLLTHSAAEHPWKATALLPPPPARCGLAGHLGSRHEQPSRGGDKGPRRRKPLSGDEKGCPPGHPLAASPVSCPGPGAAAPDPAGPVFKQPALKAGPSSGEKERSVLSQNRLQLHFPPGFPQKWRLPGPVMCVRACVSV